MFITGPAVVKSAIGETITVEELGGADIHSRKSGVAHFAYPDDESCISAVRKLLTYLPQNCGENPPFAASFKAPSNEAQLQKIVPDNPKKGYDVRLVINALVDQDSFYEVQPSYAQNLIIGFARMEGYVVGVVANNPSVLSGVLDIDAPEKGARFIRFCDCFHIPLLTLEDVPGFYPGSRQEHQGIIRKGAKLLYAYAESTVPKITLILRKAFGGAYIAMGSKGMGTDVVFAWPIAQVAVMGAEAAVEILHKRELAAAPNPSAVRSELAAEYEQRYMTPYVAAQRGFIDEVILPEESRKKIIASFHALGVCEDRQRMKKHGNIPL